MRARRDGHASVEPLAGAADHRHAALPRATTSSCATSSGATTRSACTSTRRSAAPTAPSGSQRAAHASCPSCSRSRRARRSSRTSSRGLHSARSQIFTKMFPRCGIPDAFASWDEYEQYVRYLSDTGSIDRAHADLVERPAAPRLSRPSRSGSATASRSSARRARSRRSLYALNGADRPRDRRGRAAADHPHRLHRGELLARDPLRAVRRADRPRRGPSVRVRPRGGARGAGRVGARRWPRSSARRRTSPCPRANAARAADRAATRRARRSREIYAEQVLEPARV